ncbi:MAG TPA: C4-dicarboxylate transporter DcuC [Candidatus Aphodousia faecigallinarum]|uniref:C4-dicarboxylate transporter DcuC n=1 Tax=Candidatus Aphodousia faecigallinarum TaxID=2840677 RepID=A0A9D1IHC8_9BURK|nr:C4-dicarboxylate transporter DcuC [Candidatus Aphodousia faecigallinarum]
MTFSMIGATVIVLLTIAALLKRWETRLVLITAGLAMGIISLAPNIALGNMMKNMTNASMILAICSSLGFAAVVSMTRCDVHFVGLLVKPLGKLGFFLLPFCMLVASCVAIAIPSAAGCAAALGPTMIPLMVRAGFRPAIAGAAIIGSIIPSALSPGSSHNVWVAKISNMEVMDLIVQFAPKILVLCALNIIMVTAMIFVFRDYKKNAGNQGDVFEVASDARGELPEHVNFFYAIAPILPIVLLMLGATCVPALKMSVAEAMIYGTIYTLLVTRANPEKLTKEFFNGMGKGYANILGIIVAAGCFAGGLQAAGVIDALIESLKNSKEIAALAANFGPFLMGVLTGSGDAAGHAFNQAVTPYAAEFGMKVPNLGVVASLSGALGRMCSPIAGATLVVAGMIKASPLEVSKRMAIPMIVNVILLGFIFEL